MSAFKHNIKLIRSLTGKNQEEFARLIKSNASNIKTWETTKTLPRNELIYSKIAELAGVQVNDLKDKKLDIKDIKLKVEIVEDDAPLITPRQYIKSLEDDKERAIAREEKIMGQLTANLTAMMQLLNSLQRHDHAFHETILRSLSRIEGGNIDLVLEARSSEAAQQVQDALQGNSVKSGT
jgi:transcriptional regulator with XRE-family HTH domain